MTEPVAPPTQIESRPVDGKPAVTDTLKHEPKGGTQPYSDSAWAQMQNPTAPPPQGKPAESTAPPVTSNVKSATAVVAADINWAWPTANKATTPFSEGSNKGIDFNGAAGDLVLAAASGKVTLVTNSLRSNRVRPRSYPARGSGGQGPTERRPLTLAKGPLQRQR